jgi:hypothetical protein
MRHLLVICVGLLMATRCALSAPPTTAPAPDLLCEAGSVAIPLSDSLEGDEIKKEFLTQTHLLLDSATGIARVRIIAALNASSDQIKAKDPHFFDKDFDASVDSLTQSARKQIAAASDKVTGPMLDVLDGEIADVNHALKEASLQLVLWGRYTYSSDAKDAGKPGWSMPEWRYLGLKSISMERTFQATLQLNLSPAGVPIIVPLEVGGTIALKVTPAAMVARADSPNRPVTTVSAFPSFDVEIPVRFDTPPTFNGLTGFVDTTQLHLHGVSGVSGTLTAGVDAR